MKDYTLTTKMLVLTFTFATAFFISSTYSRTATAAPLNLIANANFTTPNSSNANLPQDWHMGNWGTNTAIFTYPVAGNNNSVAAQIQITSHIDGDAKWYFRPVTVEAGKTYQFSANYTSSVAPSVFVMITTTSGVISYTNLGLEPASSTWTTLTRTITAPSNAASMTVFVLLNQVGTLSVDEYSFSLPETQTGPNIHFTAPTNGDTITGTTTLAVTATPGTLSSQIEGVIFKLDGTQLATEDTTVPFLLNTDSSGWSDGTHTLSAEARDSAGATSSASLTVITQNGSTTPPVSTPNLIANGSLEISNPMNAALPESWSTGRWGANTATFTYPVPGQRGAQAARVAITSYTDGDAKWYFKDINVTAGAKYTFSEYYTSTIPSTVLIRFEKNDSTYSYVGLETLPAASEWTAFTNTFTVPSETKSLTIFHLISRVGSLDIDAYSLVQARQTTNDTEVPQVSISSPSNSITATGTINVFVNASDNVEIALIQLSIDGQSVGALATSSPAQFTRDTTLYSNGEHTLRAVAKDTSENTATSSINFTINNDVPDTIAPHITITTPSANSRISGTTTITLTATDNVGVQNINLSIDSIAVSVPRTAPYTATIDTKNFANGVHLLKANANDAAGNIANATSVRIIIDNNSSIPPQANLITNNSLETISTTSPILPDQWKRGRWGTNDAQFTYPTNGSDGARGAEVSITSYSDGDAKWFFNDVLVVNVGAQYSFTEYYKSNTTTRLVARYTYVNGTISYAGITTLPQALDWTSSQITIQVPSGVQSMTLFHLLDSVGTLAIDNYNLTTVAPPPVSEENLFDLGMVSLTFDDGWLSQYQNALPILQNARIPASFYIITKESQKAIPDNRIYNASLDVPDPTNAALPSYWFVVANGSNDAASLYPAPGINDTSGAQVSITNYDDGEVMWIPSDTSVLAHTNYLYSESYKSTATTSLVVRYTFNDGSVRLETVDTIPPAEEWTTYSRVIAMPANLRLVTVYQKLSSVGSLSIDNTDLNHILVFMNLAQVKDLWDQGYEVSAHTRTHPDLATLTDAQATDEIVGSRADLQAIGISPLDTLVYPYGSYTPATIQIAKDAGFTSARSTKNGYNFRNTPKFELLIQDIDQRTTYDQIKTAIDNARMNRTWVIFMFHQIENSTEEFGMSPLLFQALVDYIGTTGIPVVSMHDGVLQML